MNIDLQPATYVVAVSGGVDSMVLLDILSMSPEHHLVVAHFDHGIRPDSVVDRQLVQQTAKDYGLQFVYDMGRLGADASEETARDARYEFLHRVRVASKARAVVTAHHKDDLLETAVLNILRGTGRRGLSSLRSTDVVARPLLHVSKNGLRDYAEKHGIKWREDVTNEDVTYLRNYIRQRILPRFANDQLEELLQYIKHAAEINREIEQQLVTHLHIQPAQNKLSRHYFIMLPHIVAGEVMTAWLKRHGVTNLDKKMISRLVAVAKTSQPNRVADVDKQYILCINASDLALERRDR